jgi:hypothetical protein
MLSSENEVSFDPSNEPVHPEVVAAVEAPAVAVSSEEKPFPHLPAMDFEVDGDVDSVLDFEFPADIVVPPSPVMKTSNPPAEIDETPNTARLTPEPTSKQIASIPESIQGDRREIELPGPASDLDIESSSNLKRIDMDVLEKPAPLPTTPVPSLRHLANLHAQRTPLSAVPPGARFDVRDSTASWRSSMSSFGEILPRRSFSEAFRAPPMTPPGLGPPGSGATSAILPPGLVDFIENEEYSSSDESDDSDEGEGDTDDHQASTSDSRPHLHSKRKHDKIVSLRRQYKLDAEASRVSTAIPPTPWHLQPVQSYEDDEPGDPDAALRALEGVVDPEILKSREARRREWQRRAEQRKREEESGIDYSHEDLAVEELMREQWMDIEGADDDLSASDHAALSDGPADHAAMRSCLPIVLPVASPSKSLPDLPDLGDDLQPLQPTEQSTPAVSQSFYASFKLEYPVPMGSLMRLDRYAPPGPHSGWLPSYEIPGPHHPSPLNHKRSWLLDQRTDSVARHLSLIDRDLLTHLQFDQIVSLEWARPVAEITVYDWEWFLKWDAERKTHLKSAPYRNIPVMSSVSACRARFNLVLMWTATDIVLTPPSDRPSLVNKFIRLAAVSVQ